MKGVVVLIFLVLIPLAYSISVKDLITRYSFSTVTAQINVTNHMDFMIDKNNNEINDTLVFELTTNNTAGTFIFVINLFDKNGILTNETNKTLSSGLNKINITFSSFLFSQNQFNYSIKIYNSSHSLKYRKDDIPTKNHSNYEEGFRIINITDIKINKTLRTNVTLTYPKNETHITTLFLRYNDSFISSKESKSIKSTTNYLIFNFDNETMKRTHHIGNFTISSLKIGRKTIKTDFITGFYDFRDFAASSYIFNFTDNGTDATNNKKFGILQINVSTQMMQDNNYSITLALYDLFDNLIEIKNISTFLNAGRNTVSFNINGSRIYEKKLNGPFIIKYAELFMNGSLIDKISDAHTTANYNFNDFDSPNLPDLNVNISVSDNYHYGISNVTINFTFGNAGNTHAFNIFTEIFDNKTLSLSNKTNVLNINSRITYQINFTNISDFEISAIADLQDLIEESNESNNAKRLIIRLNKRPTLASPSNITVNETDKILINLSASDANGDNLSFSINLSKLSNESNIFQWNTTTTESGNYTSIAVVSDGYLNDTALFKIVVLDNPEKDVDNDGIEDAVDKLIGSENNVNTSTINISIFLGNSRNLSKRFNESMRIKFTDKNSTIAEFDFDFSVYKLNLTNLTIDKQTGNTKGSLIVRGLKMPEGTRKTLYIDKLNAAFSGVCIKEEEIASISEISDNCNSNNEFSVECDGTLQNSYACTYNSTLNKYKVQGLKYSGIVQIDYARPASSSTSSPASASSVSGGGGGGVVCISNWKCNQWSECADGFQNRECSDTNQCAFSGKKPEELQQCVIEKRKIIDAIGPSEYLNRVVKKANQNIKSNVFFGVTGNAIKSEQSQKLNFGVFIIFVEIFIIVGAYLAIKRFFLKNL
ncbi:MAG: CARDB domain-containing protein [Nanoarchaeota archaeon]|nr:CARDB domain-containing protein [Nanoarchaeota archaeon]